MTGLRNGEARREVMALVTDIDVYLADGHSRQSIYDKYKREGKISCGYAVFCRWIYKLSFSHPHKIKHSTLPVSELKPELEAQSKPSPKSKTKKNISPSVDSKPTERTSLPVLRAEISSFKG